MKDNSYKYVPEEMKKEPHKFLVIHKDDIFHTYDGNSPGVMTVTYINRPSNKGHVVCSLDEPYVEEVWQTILEGERKKARGEK